MRISYATALVLVQVSLATAQTGSPAAGVPLDVATARAANVSDLRYELSLSIPEDLAAPLTGSNTIRFSLKDASAPLVLDFETSREHVKAVDANGKPSAFAFVNGHIIVPAASLVAGANTVRITFNAGDASLNRSKDFLYTLFVPARARLALPVFDQPDLKGRWTMTLEHPAAWQSAANGAELTRTVSGARTTVTFAETQPLPTYLVAFIAGDFKIETAERNGRTFRMFHRETDAAKVARNREAIFDLHARALAFLEDYTAIPYAFGKFDFVAIPAFQFGGMEHAGKILYNASGLMLDESATQNQLLGRASVIAHETAHMWFGDLVTMRWFNDVWMKEVFANFMAAKIVNPSFPTVNHDLRFLLSNYPAAYEVDRTPGANPIRQVLDNLNEAGSMYGAIIYQKAPVVMRHLEALLGADNFRDGLREYLEAPRLRQRDLVGPDHRARRAHAGRSAAVEPRVGRRAGPADHRDRPRRSRTARSRAWRSASAIRADRNLTWPQQLRVAIGTPAGREMLIVELNGAVVEVPQAVGKPAPRLRAAERRWLGLRRRSRSTAPRIDYLTTSLPEIDDPLTRGSAWVTLWDALLDGQVPPAAFVDLAMQSLPRETDEQMTSRILGYASNAWWRFLRPAELTARAPRFESLLREGLAQAKTPEPEGVVVRHAAQRRPHAGHHRLAAQGVGQGGDGHRAAAGRSRLHLAGAGTGGAAGARLAAGPADAAGADRESRSQGPLRVRDAGALGRSGGAREVVPVAQGRQQPPPRAVGARGPQLPAPSAARRQLREVRAAEPRDAVGHPEDRRHLLPQALARRHARRSPVGGRGRHGPRLPEEPAGELSRPPAQHHAAVGR